MRAGRTGRLWSLAIAVSCTALGAALFFSSTTPAWHEREYLHAVESGRDRAVAELAERLNALRAQEAALHWDPQTILLAIDAARLTPGELLGEPVPGMPAIPAWTPPAR